MKKLLYAVLLAVLLAGAVELVSLGLFLAVDGRYPHGDLLAARAVAAGGAPPTAPAVTAGEPAPGRRARRARRARRERTAVVDSQLAALTALARDPRVLVPHPHLGFVHNPEFDWSTDQYYFDTRITDHGFMAPQPLPGGAESRLEVAVFGGSVAGILATAGAPALARELAAGLGLPPDSVRVSAVAIGGYKQPQQLMALEYLLALGVRPDVVINVDGFNDIVLPVAENVEKGLYPFYPRNWSELMAEVPPREHLLRLARLEALRERRTALAAAFSLPVLRHSPTWNLVWRGLDRRLDGRIAAVGEELAAAAAAGERSYATHGPYDAAAADPEALRERLADVWARSSLQMRQAAATYGISYHHFLQPNQYVPGSKRFTGEELRRAVREGHVYRQPVIDGYPALVERGRWLQDEGVDFHDLTGMFREVEETVYFDDCCHLDFLGTRLLAAAVARGVVEDLGGELPPVARRPAPEQLAGPTTEQSSRPSPGPSPG